MMLQGDETPLKIGKSDSSSLKTESASENSGGDTVSVFALNEFGIITLSEGQGLDRLGFAPGQLVGASVWEVFKAWPDTVSDLRRAYSGLNVSSEREFQGLWFKNHYMPMKNGNGDIVGITGVSIDITRQKKDGDALKRSHLLTHAVIEGSTDVIYLKDCESRYQMINTFGAKFFGRTPEEIIGKSDVDLIGEVAYENCIASDQAVLSSGEPHSCEEELVHDGVMASFHTSKAPLRDSEGKVIGVLGISRDLTERKRRQNRLEMISEVSSSLASMLDLANGLKAVGRILVREYCDYVFIDVLERGGLAAQAYASGTDSKYEEILLKMRRMMGTSAVTSPAAQAIFAQRQGVLLASIETDQLRTFVESDEILAVIAELSPGSGMVIPLHARGHLIGLISFGRSKGRNPYDGHDLAFAHDLARHIALAIENTRLYLEAQDAVAARDEFLSMASHELKTPITALKVQTQLITRSLNPNASFKIPENQMRTLLSDADHQIDRLVKLIRDLLEVAGISRGQLQLSLERFGIRELFLDALTLYKAELEASGSNFELDAQQEVSVHWDRGRMEQVVRNLLANAIKYGRGKPIRATVREDGLHAEISFEDFGIGISPDERQRIFGRFKRAITGGNIDGLGLGLYIAHQIVTAHGGSIRVESELGQGSKFIVRIPIEAYPTAPCDESLN